MPLYDWFVRAPVLHFEIISTAEVHVSMDEQVRQEAGENLIRNGMKRNTYTILATQNSNQLFITVEFKLNNGFTVKTFQINLMLQTADHSTRRTGI